MSNAEANYTGDDAVKLSLLLAACCTEAVISQRTCAQG